MPSSVIIIVLLLHTMIDSWTPPRQRERRKSRRRGVDRPGGIDYEYRTQLFVRRWRSVQLSACGVQFIGLVYKRQKGAALEFSWGNGPNRVI